MRDKPTKFQEIETGREYLTTEQKTALLRVLLGSSVAFENAKAVLKPISFGADATTHQVLWASALDYHSKYRRLPTKKVLFADCMGRLKGDPETKYLVDPALLRRIIRGIEPVRTSADVDWAMNLVGDLLEESLHREVQYRLNADTGVPANMQELLKTYSVSSEHIQSVRSSTSALDQPFPDGWVPQEVVLKNTGDAFLDHCLGGGYATKEVNLILGPIGSCKTTLGMQIAVNGARNEHGWHLEALSRGKRKNPIGVWVFFSYEMPIEDLRVRALSCSAQIPFRRLEACGRDLSGLSTDDAPEDYERRVFADLLRGDGAHFRGERSRLEQSMADLNRNLILKDMTGNDPNAPSAGVGYVDEIAANLHAIQLAARRVGRRIKIAGVVVDYAMPCVDRYLSHQNMAGDSAGYYYLSRMPYRLSVSVAVRFNCVVWLIHQLSGKSNALAPGKLASGADAMGAKNLKENVATCLVLSRPTKENLAVIGVDKHRRTPPISETVVFVDGQFRTVRGTGDTYVYEGGKILTASDARQVVRDGAVGRRSSRNGRNRVFDGRSALD